MALNALKISDITRAAAYITEGRVVAVPTNTSYALAADALQGWAVQRVRNLKGRAVDKPLTVFMADEIWDTYLKLTSVERDLLTAMHDQPLTLLVKPQPSLAHLTQNGLVGLRVIDHPLMQQLAAACQVPLTATSANRSGEEPCFSADAVAQTFPNLLPTDLLGEPTPRGASDTTYDLSLAAILDGGELPHQQPTTIAKLIDGAVEIIRPGLLTAANLQQAIDATV